MVERLRSSAKKVAAPKKKGGNYFVGDSVQFVSTGCTVLDCVLGGGWALGRIANIVGDAAVGKTLEAIEACANFHHQFPKGHIWYREAEGAFDVPYGEALGLPIDAVDFGPDGIDTIWDTIEDIAEDMDRCCLKAEKSKQPGIYIIDSLDAISSRAELGRKAGEGTYGLEKQKQLGQLFRRLVRRLRRANILLIVVSQIRENIGLCFDYHAKVMMADGSSEAIGKLVYDKNPGPIISFNPKTNQFEKKRITAWHDNGASDDFLKIRVSGRRSGFSVLVVTPNHRVFTPDGERLAGELKVGDQVTTLEEMYFSEDQHDVVLGSLFGDGSLRFESQNRAHLRLGHCKEQAEYCNWKGAALGDGGFSTSKLGVRFYDTISRADFLRYKDFPKKKRRGSMGAQHTMPQCFIDMLTLKSLAIWYMDDGNLRGSYQKWGHGSCSISARRLDERSLNAIADKMQKLGLPRPIVHPNKGISWHGEDSGKFQDAIAPFVHPSMRYKLKPGRRKFAWRVLAGKARKVALSSEVVSVERAAKVSHRRRRFDITVDDTSTYLVGNVVVHNSFGEKHKRVGGKSLDFYASQILWLHHKKRVTSTVRGVERAVAVRIRAKCKKNKVGPAFRECEFVLRFGYGVDDMEASLGWLKEVGELARVGIKVKSAKEQDEKIRDLLRKNARADADAARAETAELAGVVREAWAEVEDRFRPPRRKYG